jgi:hypothetical protein
MVIVVILYIGKKKSRAVTHIVQLLMTIRVLDNILASWKRHVHSI